MKTVRATLAVQQGTFPSGTVAEQYRFTLRSASVPSDPNAMVLSLPYGIAPVTVDFDGVADGAYVVDAEMLSPSGLRLGELKSAPVTVPSEADIILMIPAGLTVQVITK